jgi:hypothetical protein
MEEASPPARHANLVVLLEEPRKRVDKVYCCESIGKGTESMQFEMCYRIQAVLGLEAPDKCSKRDSPTAITKKRDDAGHQPNGTFPTTSRRSLLQRIDILARIG